MGCTIAILAFLYFGYQWAMKQPDKPEVAERKLAEQRIIDGTSNDDDIRLIMKHLMDR
jgi:hypothetical protein